MVNRRSAWNSIHLFLTTLCQFSVFCSLHDDARAQGFTSWCFDSEERFEINYVDSYKGAPMKSCTWTARTDKFWRYTITEVLEHCPVTCDFCECFNNPGRFKTPIADGKCTCAWPERKKTEQRCSDPEVAANCPLTCGECSTTGLFVVVDSTVVIPLQGTIPTDDEELSLFKSTLIQAQQSFFLSSSSSASLVVVTDVQLVVLTKMLVVP